ncbi:MAG: class I SAM-dependent methyltransferase [Thiotrichales bacterium]
MNVESMVLERRGGQNPVPRRWRGLFAQLDRLRYGSLAVALPGGHSLRYVGREHGPQGEIVIRRPWRLLRRLALRGDLGFGEAFVAGDWDSPNLADLLLVLALNEDTLDQQASRGVLAQAMLSLRHALRRNSLRGSRRNIARHYDLGNDFYARWLDPTMTYSAAIFAEASETLAQAQRRKYERLLDLLDPKPGDHILEIGCGWGGFAEVAAQWGMKVTGITLSREQLRYAQDRAEAGGYAGQVEFRLLDYRKLDGQYDHIVSIEMFEAVGQAYWRSYFEVLARSLKPGGRAALQVITIDEALFDIYARNPGGFIQTYIFPGGMLPTRSHLHNLAAEAGLAPERHAGFGADYALTLQRWHAAFEAETAWLEEHGYDARFRRMWRYYLAFCEAGFRAKQIDVVQLLIERP